MERNWPRLIAFGTWIYAAITALILIAIIWQINSTKESSSVTLRPFVYPEGWRLVASKTAQGDYALGVSYALVNSGNTPTRHLTVSQSCRTSAAELSEPYILMLKQPQPSVSGLLGPHAALPIACSFAKEETQKLEAGALFGYVLGEVLYRDDLDRTALHRTQYAIALNHLRLTVQNDRGSLSVSFGPAGQHNCADADCPANVAK